MGWIARLIQFGQDESGTTSVEYAIVLALIVTAAVAGVSVFGGAAGNLFGEIESQLPT